MFCRLKMKLKSSGYCFCLNSCPKSLPPVGCELHALLKCTPQAQTEGGQRNGSEGTEQNTSDQYSGSTG